MNKILSFLQSLRPEFNTSICKSCQKAAERLNQFGYCMACFSDIRTEIIRQTIEININVKHVYYSDDYNEIFKRLEIILNNLRDLESIGKSGFELHRLISFEPPGPSRLEDQISICQNEHRKMLKEKNELDNFLQKGKSIRTKFSSLIREYTWIKKLRRRGLEDYRLKNPEQYEFISVCRRTMHYLLKIEKERIEEALRLKNEGKLTEAINIIEMNVKNEFWKKKSYNLLMELLRKEKRFHEELAIAQRALSLFGDKQYKLRCQVIRRCLDKIK